MNLTPGSMSLADAIGAVSLLAFGDRSKMSADDIAARERAIAELLRGLGEALTVEVPAALFLVVLKLGMGGEAAAQQKRADAVTALLTQTADAAGVAIDAPLVLGVRAAMRGAP